MTPLLGVLTVWLAAPETVAEEATEYKNSVGFKPAYAAQFLASRRSRAPEVGDAGELDHLGGFVLSYARVLVPEWFGLEVAKPFYFARGRFDSPFELNGRIFHRWRFFEPFLTLGGTFNIRVFYGEREEIEGRSNRLSFGVAAAAGAGFWVAPRWALEAEGFYAYVPAGDVVQHEAGAAAGVVFAF